jgi:hypothetical protein
MDNHHRRRADAAKKCRPNRVEAIRLACIHDANVAETTATGATQFVSDGCKLRLSANDLRALYGCHASTEWRT